jgi:hypothetical protein
MPIRYQDFMKNTKNYQIQKKNIIKGQDRIKNYTIRSAKRNYNCQILRIYCSCSGLAWANYLVNLNRVHTRVIIAVSCRQ